jgi:mannose-6-phosphate isomerase class I
MKLSKSNLDKVERETATIINFPFSTKQLSVTNIIVSGRHPADNQKWYIEHKLTLICYVIKGSGTFTVDKQIYEVSEGDAVQILPDQKYFIDGNLEYLVACSPAYYREQHEQVELN